MGNKFPDIPCGTHVVMPDHFHCILHNVGANLGVGTDVIGPTSSMDSNFVGISGEHVGSPLYRVMNWFKTITTNEYIRKVKRIIGPVLIVNYGSVIIGNISFVMNEHTKTIRK